MVSPMLTRLRPQLLRRAALGAAALMTLGIVVPASAAPVGRQLDIEVLSNRADLISGGEALVAVGLPPFIRSQTVRVTLNGRDITSQFARRPNGRYAALVTGLRNGRNQLVARASGARGATITITNHPIGGPVFAGPQIQPWVCQDTAVDAQCNEPTTYEYVYRDVVRNGFEPYDPEAPPADELIAETTTDHGKTVKYIVRTETGYLARDQYQISVLWDPEQRWAPWAPQGQWNHKLLITHGASCGNDHTTGTAPDTLDHAGLSRGFVVMSTAANNAGHNCNIVTEAESMVMAKEKVVEGYGEIRYTIGTGCSGGSLVQQQVANAYPGLYQGILPQCSFPDAWSTGQQLEDYVLLRNYHEHPDRWGLGTVWTPASIAAVEGHPNHLNSIELSTLYGPLPDPAAPCAGVTDEQRWSESNPKGVRCSMQDFMVNVFGRRRSDGYAGRPYDNVGVLYGLEALMNGAILPTDFVDLNVKVGSHDINYKWQPQRVAADRPALAYGYQSGAFNEANHLDQVAIIDLRGPDPGAFHDAYRTYALRARLDREHGTHANHVVWSGPIPLVGDGQATTLGLVAMDRWLEAVERDRRNIPLARKIILDKPADIVDQCSTGLGQVIPVEGQRVCNTLVQSYTTPRMVAGSPITTDITKCQLRPLVPSLFYPVQFLDSEWDALRKVFPTGVCDYSKRGVDQQGTRAWQTYERGPGTGRPLGPPPRSSRI